MMSVSMSLASRFDPQTELLLHRRKEARLS